MADNQVPIPQDIPWKLAGTTFGLRAVADPHLVPPGSSVSLFTHVPILPNIDVDYPDDRLIYFKIALRDCFLSTFE